MTKAQIFISHSCKDAELDDGVPLDDETDPRRRRLKFAKAVRDAVEQGLQPGFEVLLDRRLLEPGDTWRIKLLRWLGRCRGAVILLSEESIQSRWVLQEATIATWRKWLNERFALVPVLLGGIGPQQLEQAGFAPTQISEFQAARLDSHAALDSASAARLAGQVLERFAPLAAQPVDSDPMQDWVDNVAAWLGKVPEPILAKICEPLRIDPNAWAEVKDFEDERASLLAYAFLHADIAAAPGALEKIVGAMLPAEASRLIEKVLPIWVNPEAASALARVQPGPHPWYAINTEDADTARDYAQRAWCCPNWWRTRCLEFDEPVGEGQQDEAMQRLVDAIARQLGVRPKAVDATLPAMLKRWPFFVVLGAQVARTRELVQSMAASPLLQSVTCVKLAGRAFEHLAPGDVDALRLLPALEDKVEQAALTNKTLISNLNPA